MHFHRNVRVCIVLVLRFRIRLNNQMNVSECIVIVFGLTSNLDPSARRISSLFIYGQTKENTCLNTTISTELTRRTFFARPLCVSGDRRLN